MHDGIVLLLKLPLFIYLLIELKSDAEEVVDKFKLNWIHSLQIVFLLGCF